MKELLIEASREAVRLAARVCRSVQRDLGAVRALTKDDRSPVTVADLASQAVVIATLQERLGEEFTRAGMLAEEDARYLRAPAHAAHLEATLSAARLVLPSLDEDQLLRLVDLGVPSSAAPRTDTVWTLDPVDGTKGFLRGQQYAIALALIEHGRPTLGVLGCPNLPSDPAANVDRVDPVGSLYVAVAGEGVEVWPCDEEGPSEKLEPSGESTRPIRACGSVEKEHSSVGATALVLAAVGGDPEVLRLDSSAKYAVVARGQVDAYLRLPDGRRYVERIWDHAAGAVIAREAGCRVTDAFGRELDFGLGPGLEANRGIAVARPAAHARLIEAIGSVLRA